MNASDTSDETEQASGGLDKCCRQQPGIRWHNLPAPDRHIASIPLLMPALASFQADLQAQNAVTLGGA